MQWLREEFKRLSGHEKTCRGTRTLLGGLCQRMAAQAEARQRQQEKIRRIEDSHRKKAALRAQAEAAEQARREVSCAYSHGVLE